jgi:uncharacterized membrane protein YgdD (TMEM256/DUF423 family)
MKGIKRIFTKQKELLQITIIGFIVFSGSLFLLWLTNFMPFQTLIRPF